MHKFHAQYNVGTDRIEVRGIDRLGDEKIAAIEPVMYEVRERGAVVDPFISIEREAAQDLVDQLWEAGVRPVAAMREIAAAHQQAGGQVAPWLMRQLEKFINQATTTKESANGQG